MILYEAMFIVDGAKAKEDYAKYEQECHGCITRHGGEIVKSVKFDDRKLMYDISKAKRGIYILVHFHAAAGDAIRKITRQAALNENVLRVLITVDEDGLDFVAGKDRPSDNPVPAVV